MQAIDNRHCKKAWSWYTYMRGLSFRYFTTRWSLCTRWSGCHWLCSGGVINENAIVRACATPH